MTRRAAGDGPSGPSYEGPLWLFQFPFGGRGKEEEKKRGKKEGGENEKGGEKKGKKKERKEKAYSSYT